MAHRSRKSVCMRLGGQCDCSLLRVCLCADLPPRCSRAVGRIDIARTINLLATERALPRELHDDVVRTLCDIASAGVTTTTGTVSVGWCTPGDREWLERVVTTKDASALWFGFRDGLSPAEQRRLHLAGALLTEGLSALAASR